MTVPYDVQFTRQSSGEAVLPTWYLQNTKVGAYSQR